MEERKTRGLGVLICQQNGKITALGGGYGKYRVSVPAMFITHSGESAIADNLGPEWAVTIQRNQW